MHTTISAPDTPTDYTKKTLTQYTHSVAQDLNMYIAESQML